MLARMFFYRPEKLYSFVGDFANRARMVSPTISACGYSYYRPDTPLLSGAFDKQKFRNRSA
jgi:hypothetical protein